MEREGHSDSIAISLVHKWLCQAIHLMHLFRLLSHFIGDDPLPMAVGREGTSERFHNSFPFQLKQNSSVKLDSSQRPDVAAV